jgi:putative cardiolipin synthase
VFNTGPAAIVFGRGGPCAIIARFTLALILAACFGGCSTLPPGANFPKTVSVALAHPEETSLGRKFESAATEHGGNTSFFAAPKPDGC